MILLGKNIIKYTLNHKNCEVLIKVVLKLNNDISKKHQNVYGGFAQVDGQEYNEINLNNYVNAQFAADDIMKHIVNELTLKHGKAIKFKIDKKNETK